MPEVPVACGHGTTSPSMRQERQARAAMAAAMDRSRGGSGAARQRRHVRQETKAVQLHFMNPLECIKATIAARILSGDPSALTPTSEQIAFVLRLAREMGIPADGLRLAKFPI
jgi:hypothetical protein